jgi:hypothetical protein
MKTRKKKKKKKKKEGEEENKNETEPLVHALNDTRAAHFCSDELVNLVVRTFESIKTTRCVVSQSVN